MSADVIESVADDAPALMLTVWVTASSALESSTSTTTDRPPLGAAESRETVQEKESPSSMVEGQFVRVASGVVWATVSDDKMKAPTNPTITARSTRLHRGFLSSELTSLIDMMPYRYSKTRTKT